MFYPPPGCAGTGDLTDARVTLRRDHRWLATTARLDGGWIRAPRHPVDAPDEALALATDRVDELLGSHVPAPLQPDVVQALRAVVERANETAGL
jgi:hypothetical protein